MSDYLLIANAYPSERALYRNGFIHRRVKAYQANGIGVQVFYLHPPVRNSYEYEYDGVNVQVGSSLDLAARLASIEYSKILIHFVSPDMINPILELAPLIPIIVWIHGFEAESWYRRWFNFMDSSENIRQALDKDGQYYQGQLKFMNWLYQTKALNLTFVHVSKWFQENIAEPDAGALSQNSFVIPNLIDDKLFNYVEKPVDQRMKVLSIRPFASRKYANDLSVKAILELSKRPFFSQLEFHIRGEGALFDETLEPLRKFDNVEIVNGFLSQVEIAALHKEYGIFLCPTRFDSQGVSMCEAMSSGLVPISTDISAISEFVDHLETGLLGSPEDHLSLAEWIERVYFNEELFSYISSHAAERIRSQCGEEVSVVRELEIIRA